MRYVLKNAAKIVKECPITLDRFEKNAKNVIFSSKITFFAIKTPPNR